VGTPAVTTQGMGVPEMQIIASVIGQAVRDTEGVKTAEIAEQVGDLVSRFPAYARP
jgi:glycine hydroxymethyltransferase